MKTIGIMAALIALTTGAAYAQAPEKADTKIVLDFAYQGMHIGFTRGVDGGHAVPPLPRSLGRCVAQE